MKKEFIEFVKENIKNALPEEFKAAEVIVQRVEKPGKTYTGLLVKIPMVNISPCVDLDQIYEKHGDDFKKALEMVADILINNRPEQDFSWICDYTKAREKLVIRVINAETNADYLGRVPHRIVAGDIAMIVNIIAMQQTDNVGYATVDFELLDKWGVNQDQLFEDALKNSPELAPARIESIMNVLGFCERSDVDDYESKMIVVTNRKTTNGAAVLFYPGVIEQIKKIIGEEFVILPSSVHDVICVPIPDDLTLVNPMVRDVNATMNPADVLSDHAYICRHGVIEAVHDALTVQF